MLSRRDIKMGKDPTKPRGRMSSYAYFVQTCREEHKKKHPEASVNFSEFSKKCSERWKVGQRRDKKITVDHSFPNRPLQATQQQEYVYSIFCCFKLKVNLICCEILCKTSQPLLRTTPVLKHSLVYFCLLSRLCPPKRRASLRIWPKWTRSVMRER